MDTVENLRAYLTVARTGSFSAAARELGVAASVVTKRVSQLEWRLKAALFERTTRRVSLTTAGQQHLAAIQRLVSDLDGIFAGVRQSAPQLQGRLRIKVPTSLAVLHLAELFNRFQRRYPLVSVELVALDRPVNPVDEGFDIALTLMPDAFGGVIEELRRATFGARNNASGAVSALHARSMAVAMRVLQTFPNPSIERTAQSPLRVLRSAAHVER
jgi:DNA-binding transcriptional LysR family regulator